MAPCQYQLHTSTTFGKKRRDRFDLSRGYLVHQQRPTAQQRPLTSYPLHLQQKMNHLNMSSKIRPQYRNPYNRQLGYQISIGILVPIYPTIADHLEIAQHVHE
ncbi:hypothetical protein LOAG_02713 [Loa loa]|uniref:Ovule protein n=1 Tax=Loa loa TaxID=7209 RepID=A0A1I7VV92_LOALO|nr:hypothetical protein LOAG_02713 [Loa loa]EFO25777.1 hypothetical protein LOAG_02713 [Loa loa]